MNIDLWLQTKLSGDWGAQAAASGLTEERLTALTRMFGGLDSMVKVRLLLAGLFVPRSDRGRLQPLLSELSSQAGLSQDEWVRATAAAVGDMSGPLDMRALMAQFPLVRDTMTGLSSRLEGLETPATLLPQAEEYMHGDISRLPAGGAAPSAAAGGSGGSSGGSNSQGMQFRLRDPPALPLVDFGLGAHPVAPSAAAGGSGGLSGAMMLGGGSGNLDTRATVGASAGAGTDAMARRGPGDGETFMLRSRANVSHSTAFKDAKQAPPTPKGGGAAAPPGLPMRLSRARSLVGPDGVAVAAADSPHQQQQQQQQAPAAPGLAALHTGLPGQPLLGRRDSQGVSQTTPRYTATHTQPLHTSALMAAESGGGLPHAAALHATSTADATPFADHAAGEFGSGGGRGQLGQHEQDAAVAPGQPQAGTGQLQAGAALAAEAGAVGALGAAGLPWPPHAAAGGHEHQQGMGQEAAALEDDGDGEPDAKRFRAFG